MNHLKSLALIGECWRDKQYPLRKQAIIKAAPEFCLSQPSFELALDWIFSHWTEENIKKLSQSIRGTPLYKEGRIEDFIQILAGTTPAMIAQGFLQGALLNIAQCIKLPRHQTVFAYLLYQSFQEIAPEIAALFSFEDGKNLCSFYQRLNHADLVIAYGHDETMEIIKKYLSSEAVFITHGHAESAAIIFKEAANKETLQRLSYDMLSYDQRGCLSPRITLVEEGGELSPSQCAEYLAENILPEMSKKLPRGGLFEGEAAEILHQRSLYAFRGSVYTGEDWTVCYEENLAWPTIALPRFMPFQSFHNIEQLKKYLPVSLMSIGYAGSKEKIQKLAPFSNRFCMVGEMQKQCLIF